jgi:hypothetical protein
MKKADIAARLHFSLCALFLVTAALPAFRLFTYAGLAAALIATCARRLVVTLFTWHL